MRTRDFYYDLPEALIAQQPEAERSASRLLHLHRDTGQTCHHGFKDLPELLRAGDCLVFNDTRVIPARLYGHKASGGRVEILIERLTGARSALAQVRASKTPKPGSSLSINNPSGDSFTVKISGRQTDLFELNAPDHDFSDILQQAGHVPLPPYISRTDDALDAERYQTVYARRPGAVAAPTAGLHFDQTLLDQLAEQDIDQVLVTLHVGAGTFQPVRSENIEDHQMHSEYLDIDADSVARIEQARQRGGRIIAVGTTAVRALETASQAGKLAPFHGETDIFIYPGYRFRTVDAMITNFHLPESSLLMLVSAFAGRETILAAYRQAIEARYRFFSYGDAMFIE